MLDRRTFIQNTMLTGIGLSFTNPLESKSFNEGITSVDYATLNAGASVTDEKYWQKIRSQFHVPKGFINLENGYFSPQPKSIIAFHQQRENYINTNTSWFMRREQEPAIEGARTALAKFLDCPTDELALTRNTTESMNIVISGFPWKEGDEVVIGNQDYGSMVSAYQQAAKRHGIIIKVAEIPLHPKTPYDVVRAYVHLFSPQTRLVHITHLINLSGQVVPVAAIAEIAKARQIKVMVDSAHSVAHLKFSIPDLNADYVGASLHKWLCNPLGAGFLWMKKENIADIFPLNADDAFLSDAIRKFEHQGTRPIHTLETIPEAIKFHNSIGSEIKQNRLRYLMRYWVKQVDGTSKITINTPYLNDFEFGAIANVAVEGFTPAQLSEKLLKDFNIFTVAIDHPAIKGVRITPHIYNTLEELDALVVGLKKIAAGN